MRKTRSLSLWEKLESHELGGGCFDPRGWWGGGRMAFCRSSRDPPSQRRQERKLASDFWTTTKTTFHPVGGEVISSSAFIKTIISSFSPVSEAASWKCGRMGGGLRGWSWIRENAHPLAGKWRNKSRVCWIFIKQIARTPWAVTVWNGRCSGFVSMDSDAADASVCSCWLWEKFQREKTDSLWGN